MTETLIASAHVIPEANEAPVVDAGVHFKRCEKSDGAAEIEYLPNEGPCFMQGTRIATPAGGVAIENLRAGDMVLTLTGATRPVRWIACRHIDLTRHSAPQRVRPVRIRARAFPDQRPIRDLFVSPDLGVWREGRLVPARLLINGSTIAWDTQSPSVIYFHIGLDTHELLLAEGLPAESYIDTDSRSVANEGTGPGESDMYVVAGGRMCKPLNNRNGRLTFMLPNAAGALRIHTARPVGISGIVFRQGAEVVPIPMDHPMLTDGWHPPERDERSIWRQAGGDVWLDSPVSGSVVMEIEFHP